MPACATADRPPLTPFVLALILLAALVHAGWNLVAKTTGGDLRFALLTAAAVALVWSPAGAWVTWREAGGYGPLQWGLIVASGAVHVLYYGALLTGYRRGDLSVVYPLARGTGPLITAMVATTWLGERLGPHGWAGVAGIVAGIVLLAGGPALWQRLRHGQAADPRLRAGLRWGALTGLFIAGYSVVDGYAVKHAGVSPIAVDYLGNLVRLPLTLALLWAWPRRGPMDLAGCLRRWWRPALLIGALSPVSYVLVLYAATLAPLSQVAPAREVSMLVAAFLGGQLLGERDRGWRLLGAACIGLGVVVLATA
ncbi:EamA family transporter [Aquabacterium sp. J223]|uniref:EamA family transporter n=1 Tax=Aquabacterium sp. J223 TaxID=2898431 RepID=UPI0021ADAC76|nr:EamA family transporter [Aquabacterium sp. J223]UUX97699.1 EamA family transporter [Aquabacterium sp. J223]